MGSYDYDRSQCESPSAPSRRAASSQAVVDRLERCGHSVVIHRSAADLLAHGMPAVDIGWVRVVPGSFPASDLPAYWLAAHALDVLGVPLLNTIASQERAASKALCAIAFRARGLRTPSTWLVPSGGAGEHLPVGPMIVKPSIGARGEDVALVDDLEAARAHQARVGHRCVVQEFVPAARGIRAVATPRRTVRMYEKELDEASPIASISQGARRREVSDPSGRIAALAQAMVAAVGGRLMGVDILAGADGRLWALEANGSFGFDPDDDVIADAFVDELVLLAGERVPDLGAAPAGAAGQGP